MGCELNRQLSSPWRGCRAGSSMAMELVKECLEMEFQVSGVHELVRYIGVIGVVNCKLAATFC